MFARSAKSLSSFTTQRSLRNSLIGRRCLATVSSGLQPNTSYKNVTHPDDTAPSSTHSLIANHSSYLLNTYSRPSLLFTHGQGSTLYSSSPSTSNPGEKQSYLDFTAGIAVNALGHGDAQIADLMKDQAGKLMHSSNVVWNEWAGELAQSLIENTRQHGGLGFSPSSPVPKDQESKGGKVFFTNSGTESNEGALKFARLNGKLTSESKTEIVCFSSAFHGRSLGALSVTPNPKYQAPFAPLIPGVKVGKFNEANGLNELITKDTCGVIVEPIQGEGGVNAANVEWLTAVGKRCREVGAVLIYDEIQCGLFRTGSMWAHSKFPAEAQPDIVTMAKPLANGFPIGAIMVRDSIASAVTVGSHGTTFGGQVLATRIAAHVLSRLSDSEFLSQMNKTAEHLSGSLDRLPRLFPGIIGGQVRGRGMIRGLAFKHADAPAELVKRARQRGLLLLTAGSDAVRIVPSLNVTIEECDKASAVIESALQTMVEDGWGVEGTKGQEAKASAATATSGSMKTEDVLGNVKHASRNLASSMGGKALSQNTPNGARAFSTSARRSSEPIEPMPPVKAGLNRHSKNVTQSKSQGASQAMLYATEGVQEQSDFDRPMVGVASVWYEGNPCNKHLLGLGQRVKRSLVKSGIIGYQFGTVGVSDGISMGTFGMSYSLQSRDLIADQVETAAGGHWLDGMVVVPGCDKNMPGTLMALGRLNRPGLMVYGGTIKPGSCGGEKLDIVSAFQSYGQYLQEGQTEEAEIKRANIIRNACPGAGACGGMYTANTMASAAEAMGMTLPGSSSFPAEYPEKNAECDSIGSVMLNMLEKNILPRDIMTREAFENAMVLTMVLGGSTNAVLHFLAIAHSVGVKLTIDDVQSVSDRIPFLADLKPSGKYVMEDINTIGGIPSVMAYLIKEGLMNGNTLTVTGKTLGENVDKWQEKWGKKWEGQDIIRPVNNPIKSSGHIRILKGNLAPKGAVAKITGKEGLTFSGKCRAFDKEEDFVEAVEGGTFKKGEKAVVVLRYLGPTGGPGMPEMLKPTSLIMGAGLGYDVACLTDGRFSGGSHGFVIGHVTPEAQLGGPIALVQDGDMIHIDANTNTLTVDVSDEELAKRRESWVAPPLKVSQGALYKYTKVVSDASSGCVTDA